MKHPTDLVRQHFALKRAFKVEGDTAMAAVDVLPERRVARHVLQALDDCGPLTVLRLAATIGADATVTASVVASLHKSGLVLVTGHSAADARVGVSTVATRHRDVYEKNWPHILTRANVEDGYINRIQGRGMPRFSWQSQLPPEPQLG